MFLKDIYRFRRSEAFAVDDTAAIFDELSFVNPHRLECR